VSKTETEHKVKTADLQMLALSTEEMTKKQVTHDGACVSVSKQNRCI